MVQVWSIHVWEVLWSLHLAGIMHGSLSAARIQVIKGRDKWWAVLPLANTSAFLCPGQGNTIMNCTVIIALETAWKIWAFGWERIAWMSAWNLPFPSCLAPFRPRLRWEDRLLLQALVTVLQPCFSSTETGTLHRQYYDGEAAALSDACFLSALVRLHIGRGGCVQARRCSMWVSIYLHHARTLFSFIPPTPHLYIRHIWGATFILHEDVIRASHVDLLVNNSPLFLGSRHVALVRVAAVWCFGFYCKINKISTRLSAFTCVCVKLLMQIYASEYMGTNTC